MVASNFRLISLPAVGPDIEPGGPIAGHGNFRLHDPSSVPCLPIWCDMISVGNTDLAPPPRNTPGPFSFPRPARAGLIGLWVQCFVQR
jgi:hypothetical protein